MDEKTLNILLKFGLDNQALSRVKSGVTSLESELDKASAKAAKTQQSLMELSEGAKKAGQNYAKVFAVGAGITGGIFAAAERYVKNAQVATDTTKQWVAQTERLNQTQNRIGAVLAKEALPLLKQAADLAAKAADFVERNPEIVKAALNIGVAIASIGAIGMAVTKGIKLYADVKLVAVGAQQLLAGKLMSDAAKMQLTAAAAGKYGVPGGLIGPAAAEGAVAAGGAGAGLTATLAPIVATVASLLAGSYLGTKLGNMGGKAIYGDDWKDKGFKDSMKDVWETTRKIALLANPIHLLAGGAEKLGIISGETRGKLWELQKSIVGLGDAAQGTKGGKTFTPSANRPSEITDAQKQIVDAYVQMLDEEKAATKQYASDRLKIITDSQSNEIQIMKNYARSRNDIVKNYNNQVSQITQNYQTNAANAERNYTQQRAETIRNAGVEIQRIEEDHQAALRRLLEDHNQRVAGLVASRDALGLVKEERDYERQRQAEEENTTKEIARRRQDVATTLRDMAAQYAAERAARLAEYKQALKDAEAQKKEQLARATEAYRAEMEANRKAKADALRELDAQYKSERERRRAAFMAQVRDLDAANSAEQKRKREYYAAMLKDVDAFAAAYRRGLPSSGNGTKGSGTNTVPVRDDGGYASKGIYGLAQNGKTEYVLSGDTTKAAEALIGGQLTQSKLIAAMSGGGQGRITWNDHRTFSGSISLEERRAITNDTLNVINGAMRKAFR